MIETNAKENDMVDCTQPSFLDNSIYVVNS